MNKYLKTALEFLVAVVVLFLVHTMAYNKGKRAGAELAIEVIKETVSSEKIGLEKGQSECLMQKAKEKL